jgi:hypothetical protein
MEFGVKNFYPRPDFVGLKFADGFDGFLNFVSHAVIIDREKRARTRRRDSAFPRCLGFAFR